MEEMNARNDDGRRLVLGFDAGCITCIGLAKRIEATVGDRLEVRSLSDPAMEHWRVQALGEDAPWAPTLIEVDADRVKAWTGLRVGIALSRRLGPAATWSVMQALGETASTTESIRASTSLSPKPDSGGIDRGQFLRALGGAAAAVPLLYAGGIASAAGAQPISAGTPAQRRQIADMILDSKQHKRIVSKLNKPLDFASASFNVSEEQSLASVSARTKASAGVAAVALFFVDLRTGDIQYYRHAVLTPKGVSSRAVVDAEEVDIVAYEDGTVLGRVSLNDGSVVTPDGRKMSVEQFGNEAKKRQKGSNPLQEREVPVSSRSCRPGYKQCERNRFNFCYKSTSALCAIARYFGIAGQIACWLYPNKRSGCRSIAITSCYRDYC